MSTKYPKPAHAASIWLEGDQLLLDFESHTVKIPLAKCSIECSSFGNPLARQLGWNSLLGILRDREIAQASPTIAKKGAPVQFDVEQMVKAYKAKKTMTLANGVEVNIEELTQFLKQEGLI